MSVNLILGLALGFQAATLPAWTPAPAPADVTVLPGAMEISDCGGLLRTPAYCVGATLAAMGDIAEAYVADLQAKGWIAADGDENRVIFVKRRPGGGCEAMQMQAFYDVNRPAAPEAPSYLAFAVIPRDICVAEAPVSPSAQ
ncbi:MAG: hypothetical protein EON89_09320 [Brevundimonas sp.]|nr:MAG: hypothetical protein EON89_09320 [Brevundimonas sp.]